MGYYGSGTQYSNSSCEGLCDPASFCLAGAVRRNASVPCPPWVPKEVCALTLSCPPGFICRGDGEAATDCPAGFFCAGGNDNTTLARDAGGRVVAVGPTGLCAAGAFCPARSTSSSGVVASSPFPNRTLSPPHLCPPGTTNGFQGKGSPTDCVPCSTGTFNGADGGNFPLCQGQCVPGQRGVAAGLTNFEAACQFCEPGTFASVPGQASCVFCPLGSFTTSWGSTNCTP